MKITARVLNVEVVKNKIKGLEDIDWEHQLGKAAAVVEAAAKENLLADGRVKSGNLVRSIQYEVDGNTAIVFTPVPYAPYVEYGTGKFADPELGTTGGRQGWWVYVDESCGAPESKNRNIYTKEEAERVWHILASKYGEDKVFMTQGQAPTRFMRRAIDENEDKIRAILNEPLEEGVK